MAKDEPPDPNPPGWMDAPPFIHFATAYQAGLGAVFFGVTADGKLWAISSEPDGWKTWFKNDWSGPGQPDFIEKVAALASQSGEVQIWAIDDHGELWSDKQGGASKRFGPWERNWNAAPRGLSSVAAVRRTGKSKAAVWGIQSDYSLISCYQRAANSASGANTWSPWETWPDTPDQYGFYRMAPMLLNDGRAALWVIDRACFLWCRIELEPGGPWGEWTGQYHWNNAPDLLEICACQQGGGYGILVGVQLDDFSLITTHQLSSGGGWSEWTTPGWDGAPKVLWAVSAQQKDGTVRLWVNLRGYITLESIAQTSPGGAWGQWDPPLSHTH